MKLTDKLEVFYADLREMRQVCEDDRRQPSVEERRKAAEILGKIKAIESGVDTADFFSPGPIAGRPPLGNAGGYRNGGYRPSNGPFKSLGDQLVAIVSASVPGGEVDQRLPQFRAAAGANEGLASDGGFLVQTDFANDLLTRAYYQAQLAPLCNRKPISGNSNGMRLPAIDETSRATGSRLGGIQMFWVGEGDTEAPKKPKFRQIEVNLKKIMGLCYATDELLADSAMLANILADGFSQETAFMLDDSILNGTGAGMPLGIMNGPCLVTVNKEAGQIAKTVQYENILSLWSRMPARNRKNAVWVINQEIEPQLFGMGMILGTSGSPVFMPGGGISGSPYSTIFNRAIIPVEQAATLGAKGDIILADFSEYLLVDKGGINFQSSIHVRFIYDEMTFRTTYRVDGQPIPNSATTSFKGSNAVSPFVVLESR